MKKGKMKPSLLGPGTDRSKASLLASVCLLVDLACSGVMAVFLLCGHEAALATRIVLAVLLFCSGAVLLLTYGRTMESARDLQLAIDRLNDEPRYGAFEHVPKTHRRFDMLDRLMFSIRDLFEGKYLSLVLDKQIELQHLQNQINPHFIYNTLEGIRATALLGGSEDIANMTETLALFLRYNIGKVDEMVPLGQELQNLERYIAIQKFRFGNKIGLSIKIDQPELYRKLMMPKLTLQPIVENSVYHGLEPKKEGGMISISAIVSDQSVRLCITDDGIGMDEETLIELNKSLLSRDKNRLKRLHKKNTGIALDNINERIKIFYGNSYGLSIHSTEGMGTDVYVKFPLPLDMDPRSGYLRT